MAFIEQEASFVNDIQHNCNISDARDHGIYSMCTMVLKLRNLYKWEYGLEPWQEAEPGDLLDWIDGKEKYWTSIAEQEYRMIDVSGRKYAPNDPDTINLELAKEKLIYGAGYGRSMKAVFFLAEQLETRQVAGCPVMILDRAMAREMASPVAMVQDGSIYIHKDSLRFFMWDQIQELRSSCRSAFIHTLKLYDLLDGTNLDHEKFREQLDRIVEEQ
ncbi:MAG: Sfum_1244 family protein, partial [Desulforhopalus sp.]